MLANHTSNAFITNIAAFLPGPPVSNEEMEDVLGMVGGKPSRARRLVLHKNGIKKRHYVYDPESGKPKYNNAQLTAAAVRALVNENFTTDDIDCLACGTTLPDQLAPNHAVMVHGEIGNPCCEVVATAGICLSGITALKYAYLAVLSGQAANAVATGSEVASLAMHAQNFSQEFECRVAQLESRPEIAFEKDFLRWMLSDGAGAMLLQSRPRADGISLRIEAIELFSYAHKLPVCMYAGAQKDHEGNLVSWRSCRPEDWLANSVFAVKQDVNLLNENIAKYACAEPAKILMKKRNVLPEDVDYFLPHLSSYYFREAIASAMAEVGFHIPQERWFTNLEDRGNTGSASPYIMLDELFHSGRLQPGETILLAVPESGRFSSGFAYFTVV